MDMSVGVGMTIIIVYMTCLWLLAMVIVISRKVEK